MHVHKYMFINKPYTSSADPSSQKIPAHHSCHSKGVHYYFTHAAKYSRGVPPPHPTLNPHRM